jgi:hypothetical protein
LKSLRFLTLPKTTAKSGTWQALNTFKGLQKPVKSTGYGPQPAGRRACELSP